MKHIIIPSIPIIERMGDNTGTCCSGCADKRLEEYQSRPEPVYRVGDFVKTAFSQGGRTEHMWVELTLVQDEALVGTLANDPVHLSLTYGMVVTVDRKLVQEYMAKE